MAKRIVVVDDDQGILELVKTILEFEGYEVYASTTGSSCFSLHVLPDLFLLDIFLNGEDGRVISHQLKSRQHTRDIPIILLSANYLEGTRALKGSDANDFLPKPFHLNELLKKVQQYTNPLPSMSKQ